MSFNIFLFRIFVCFFLSILIALERQCRHRMVGLRTNVLVSLGAFLFMYVSFGLVSSDKSRIASQIVSGIGFLGAGVILRDGSKVKGLNTAATLWCVAAIGVMTCSGLLKESIVGTMFVLLSNIVLRLISKYIMQKIKLEDFKLYVFKIVVSNRDETNIRSQICKYLEKYKLIINSLDKSNISDDLIEIKLQIFGNKLNCLKKLILLLCNDKNVLRFNWYSEVCKVSEIECNDDFQND